MASPKEGVFGPSESPEYVNMMDEIGRRIQVPADQAWEYADAMHYTATEEGEQ